MNRRTTAQTRRRNLDFRIQIEEGVDALAQLFLDIILRSLDDMKGDARLAAVLKLHRASPTSSTSSEGSRRIP